MKRLFVALALALLILSLASSTLAHAVVTDCNPGVGGTVESAPKELHCSFSQSLAKNNTIVVVTNEQRERVDLNDARIDLQDSKKIVVSLDGTKMPRGYYRVQYAVVSAEDFDLTEGSFYFGVQVVVPPTPTPAATALTETTPVTPSRIIPLFIGAAVIVFAGALIVLLRVWRESRDELER